MSDISVEFMANHGNCCSHPSGQKAPCCHVQQDTPEEGLYFLPTPFRAGSPDLFQLGSIHLENQNLSDQIDFQSKECLVLSIPRSTPLYLQILSILC